MQFRWTLVLATAALVLNAIGARGGSLVCGSLLVGMLVARRWRGASGCGEVEGNQARERLEAELADAIRFLDCVPSILVGLDCAGRITRWNPAAVTSLGLDPKRAAGQTLDACGVDWVRPNMATEISHWLESAQPSYRSPDIPYRREGTARVLGMEVHGMPSRGAAAGFILTGADLTERRSAELVVEQSQRLESVGQLAAGIAHEINTPIQYVGDNLRFLRDAFQEEQSVLRQYERLRREAEEGGACGGALRGLNEALRAADMGYLRGEIPNALAQSLEGVERVATIVSAMKEFAHPGRNEESAADLNKALLNTLIVARNELKYVADVETGFGELPPVTCCLSEVNQVFLNLLINAAHAIAEVIQDKGVRGKITVRTWQEGENARIAISDTGCGIAPGIASKVFDPFFTTKPIGKGTGQGLAIARSIVVEKHGGSLTFVPNGAQGTTFLIALPIHRAAAVPWQTPEERIVGNG